MIDEEKVREPPDQVRGRGHGRRKPWPNIGPSRTCGKVEKQILLNSVDSLWREHLIMLEHLASKVVGWRGYGPARPAE